MKKIVFSCILSTLILCGISITEAQQTIDVKSLDGPKSDCNSRETTNYTYYLDDDGYYTHPADDFWVEWFDALILNSKNWSSIDIWRWKNDEVLTNCDVWRRMSDAIKDGDKVVAFKVPDSDRCTFNIPKYTKEKDPEAIDAQIHFTIWYRKAWNNWPKTRTNQHLFYKYRKEENYRCYPSWNPVKNTDECPRVTVKVKEENKTHVWECQNYRLFWCGDGLVNGRKDWKEITTYDNGTFREACDPEASEWKNRADWKTCSATCTIVEPVVVDPVCNSKYNNQTEYTKTSSNHWLSKTTSDLCTEWTVDDFSFTPATGGPRTYTWNCINGFKTTNPPCTAKQEWCGDWTRQEKYEDCDDGANNGKSTSSCSKECKSVNSSCWTQDKWTTYFKVKKIKPWLDKTSDGMCAAGLTASDPKMVGDHIEWTCTNVNWWKAECKAYQEWCGDWKKNGSEICDPEDSKENWWNEEWWWNDGCSATCEPKNEVVNACNEENTFYYNLRHGYKYTFWDIFNAKDADRRLFGDPVVIFTEQKDFNEWDNPTFKRTNRSSEKKVARKTSVKVVESTPKYYIKTHPDVRSDDNIYIEYDIKYGNSSTAPESRQRTHKECAHYLISWCGDGVLDEDWEWRCDENGNNCKDPEECDPGSEGTKVLPDGRICDSDCKIKDAPKPEKKWKLKVEKYQNEEKKYVTKKWQEVEWEIKVTAEEWDVKNVIIKDKLPKILWYSSYTEKNMPSGVKMKANQPTKSNAGKTITWETTWTLKEWESIILVVKTIVEELPHMHDKYENVACAEWEWLKEDCTPAPIKWDLETEKTLVSESKYVKELYQELVWQVKVTAVWWEVDNPKVKDYLPKVLWYKSMRVISMPSGVTLNSEQPKTSKDSEGKEFKRWQTTWILKEWESIIFEITTEVIEMPDKNGYENVACAWAEWLDEKCDRKPIPTAWELKVEKTLLSDSKYVEKEGQELVWEVKVTAENGDVKDVMIKDYLPPVLSYVSTEPKLPSGITLKSKDPDDGKDEEWRKFKRWQTKWTLKDWESIILIIKTKVDKMPDKKGYKNVACAWAEWLDEHCQEVPLEGWLLTITKTLQWSPIIKQKWDELTWWITVTAEWWDYEENFTIEDKMPDVLGYKESMIIEYWNTSITGPILYKEDNKVEWKVTWPLKAGQSILIQLTTEVTRLPDKEYKNVACEHPDYDPTAEKCDDEPTPTPKLRIKKYILDGDKEIKEKTVKVWDEIVYKIKFWNKWDASATITSIKDFLPKNIVHSNVGIISSEIYINGKKIDMNSTESTQQWETNLHNWFKVVDWVRIDIYDWLTLEPGDEWFILIKWKILEDNQDQRQNWACIYLNGETPDSSILEGNPCDDVIHNFENNICKKLDITPTWNLWNDGWTKEVTCTTEWNQIVDLIEIDCWDGATSQESWKQKIEKAGVNELKTTCKYPWGAKTYNLQCQITKDGTKYTVNDSCKWSVSVEGSNPPWWGDDPYCKAPVLENNIFTCTSTDKVYAIGIDCNHEVWKESVDKEKKSWDGGREVLSVSESCSQSANVQCYVKKNSTSSWETIASRCWWTPPGDNCFPAGTKVTMADGIVKNIEDIEEWDIVLSYNTDTDTNESSVVEQRIVHEDSEHEMYELTINWNVLRVTAVHPFYVRKSVFSKDYAWIEAQNLKVWDILLMKDGSLAKIEKINHYSNKETVYNLEVEGNHDYFVAEWYLVHNKWWSSCFVAWTKVLMADWSEKNIEDVRIWEKVLWSNWTVNTVLWYDRPILANRHLWSINGSEYFVSDEHPFKTTEWWKSFDPEMTKLEVNLDTTELKVWDILITNSGLEEIKSVDYISADYDTPLYNFKLDGDHTYYANDYLVHNKDGGGDDTPPLYDWSRCFNVNANQDSIEQWEVLIFFWNIERLGQLGDFTKYFTVLKGGFKETAGEIRNDIIKNNKECTEKQDGMIALNSMICYFEIKDWNNLVVESGEFPCLRDTGGKWEDYVSNKALLDAWMTDGINKYKWDWTYKFYWSFTNKDTEYGIPDKDKETIYTIKLRSNINYIEKFGSNLSTFGEYKVSLTKLEYLQCKNGERKLDDSNVKDWDCESDFVLTNPYTVQKTPSGNLRASTTTLGNYLYMSGKPVSGLLNAKMATSAYTPNTQVNKAMSDFINKYQKLAVDVKNGKWKYKKVPGKNIYFVKWDLILWWNKSDIKFDKPVTFIQTEWDTTINWSFTKLNMMLLTNGSITFNDNCKNRQVVKWIFYSSKSKNGIIRTWVQKNKDVNKGPRCTEGWLTIKWVLIWNWLDQMMQDSRSNLNNWFDTDDDTKRNIVMNWASVLIEYSPSVFTKSTMPPGAEDFTTALSIYKD